MTREITEIKNALGELVGYKLRDLRYYIEPLDKKETINLHDKSQIFLTIDGNDTEVALSDVFLSIYSIQGDTLRGYTFLTILDEKNDTIEINKEKTKVTLYDKVTGVHFRIREIDTVFFMGEPKQITVEQMGNYASILDKGKVTAKNAVVEGQGVSVEDLLLKAEEEKKALEEKERLEKEAAEEKERLEIEAKEKEEREAKEKKEAEEAEAKRVEEETARIEAEVKEKKEREEREAAEKLEAEEKAKQVEAQKIADAEQRGRIEAIKKQLGGQDYLDLKAKLEDKGYEEFDKGNYRFFFKDDKSVFYLRKLVAGDMINLEDSIEDGFEDTKTGEVTYPFKDGEEEKNLIFDAKEGEIKIKKTVASE